MSNTTAFVLVLLLGAVVGGLGVFFLGSPSGEDAGAILSRGSAPVAGAAPRTETDRPLPADPQAGAGTASSVGKPAATAEAFVDAQTRNEELKREVAALRTRLPEKPRPPENPPTFSFGIPEDAPAFASADWKKLGGHATRLTALLRKLREDLGRGERPSPAAQTRIQQENMPLALLTVQLAGDVDDLTTNGAFVHPAVTANLAGAMLEEASLPLTAEQEGALDVLGGVAASNLNSLVAGFSAAAPEIGKTAELTDQRLQFVDALRGVLTPEQDGFLFPPETAGRLKLDLLSPVLVYVISAPVEATDRAQLGASLVGRVLTIAGTPREDIADLAWIGERWVDDIPGVLEPLDVKNTEIYFPHVDLCQSRAHAEAAAIRRLVDTGSFSEEEVLRLRALNMLLYPYLRGTSGD